MEKYIYTDLAWESHDMGAKSDAHWTKGRRYADGAIEIFEMRIETEERARALRHPIGKYVTVMCEKIWLLNEETLLRLRQAVTRELFAMLSEQLTSKKGQATVLVVGLGNDAFTVDSVGPRAAEYVNATRNLSQQTDCRFSIAVMSPGVLGKSGMETVEQIGGVASAIGADAVLAMDALAASHYERLGTTIQIADSGICPGSGVGNARKAITKQTLGIPVIAIGVPTVVDAATMICDALTRGGMKDWTPQMEKAVSASRGLFVCPKESDLITQSVSLLLAEAINALGGIKDREGAYSEA